MLTSVLRYTASTLFKELFLSKTGCIKKEIKDS